MSNRDKLLLAVLRTVFMVLVGVLFISVPWIVPDSKNLNWVGTLVPISIGLMIFYVEIWLWYHRFIQRHRS